ncbi:MAG TPA: triose-phosphate isomerase, partial [Candidatus Saccharimonas sp.]|nr:triose-phosphate isomerase [Candidatus Saccharimonas sp.]
PDANVEVVICPPFIDIYPIAKELDKKKLILGCQNIHYLDQGAFTGEISPAMLKGLVGYAIIGHSERRAMGEDDKLIAKKAAAALRNDIVPILCVGESLTDREHGLSAKVVTDQVTAGLSQLTAADVARLVIAYEPVWAISHGDGQGQHATPDQVRPQVQTIRSTVEELYGEEGAGGLRVIYGGSVNPDDCKAYLKTPGIDGLLVGGASLNYEEFANIVKAAQ